MTAFREAHTTLAAHSATRKWKRRNTVAAALGASAALWFLIGFVILRLF